MSGAKVLKRELPAELPKGCIAGVAPDGETPIIVRAPRGPGPWFRVMHPQLGHELIRAATAEEAIEKFASQNAPAESRNKKWLDEFAKQVRTAKLPEPAAAPATA
jgi:hypothetical protein